MTRAFDRVAFSLLVLVLFLAPFPVASNRDGLVGVSATLIWLAVSLCLLARALPSARSHTAQLQLADLPSGTRLFLGLLAAVVAWIWIGPLLLTFPALDVPRAQVYQAKAASYLGMAVLVTLLVRDRARLLIVLGAVVVSATLQALIGIVVLSVHTEFILFGVSFRPMSRAHGTFANPDHFANYMAMSLALGIGLLLATAPAVQSRFKGWQARVHALLSFVMSARMLVRLALIVIVIALVLSRSRMGNASFGIGLLVLLAAVAATWAEKRRAALWLGASVLLVDLIVVGQWVGLERVVERLQNTELTVEAKESALADDPYRRHEETVEERLSIGRDAFKLVQQAPLTGHGPATFYALFPQVKNPKQLPLFFDHAHNDYAEIASDLGVMALAGLGGVVVLSLFKWAQLMRSPTPTLVKGAASGAGMAVVCMLLHAVVDFNLHIHANALLFSAAVALPFALSTLQAERRHRSSRRRNTHG